MPHETLSQQEEQSLLRAVKEATDLVGSGLTPDAAIEKVAREHSFGPGRIRTVAHAYNTGMQVGQWHGGGSILDKMAAYDLADPEAVIQNIYKAPPEKTALDPDYDHPPTWLNQKSMTKAAAAPVPRPAPEPEPLFSLHKAYGNVQRDKQAIDELSRQASKEEDAVRAHVASLVNYFKQASYSRLPFHVVESAARSYHGDAGSQLMDLIYTQSHIRDKRASDEAVVLAKPLDRQTAPLSLVDACIKSAVSCGSKKRMVRKKRAEAAESKEEAFRPFGLKAALDPPPTDSLILEHDPTSAAIFDLKQANWTKEVAAIATGDILATKATHGGREEDDPYGDIRDIEEDTEEIDEEADAVLQQRRTKTAFMGGSTTGSAAITAFGRVMGDYPEKTDELIEGRVKQLEDPEHQNEIRKIRAHAMLNQMMTDPDDPISSHDYDRVLNAYNELSQFAPRATANAASLRPLLRRRLEGYQEPFEVKELSEIEKSIGESQHVAARQPTPAAPAAPKR